IDEKFDIPSINLTNIPMQVSCTTKVTKEGNEYKAVGETKATFMNFPLPVEIKATFDDAGKIDMDIYVSGIPIPNMGNIVVNFKGLGQKMIEPCFLPD
ncbi:MAG: hypothetical protein FWF09_05050, partial [Bacteroidales bacterium]|nr:hypothetical protein [Bacteroidales bacterium]